MHRLSNGGRKANPASRVPLGHAHGEETGYFAPGVAGSNPAFGRTYRGGASRGRRVAGSGSSSSRDGLRSRSLKSVSPFLSVTAVVKMTVTSVERRASGGRWFNSSRLKCRSSEIARQERQQHRPFPAKSFAGGEESCYFVSKVRILPGFRP